LVPTKLHKLLVGEISGVDDPANEIPGWMVLKSSTPVEDVVVGKATVFNKGRTLGPDQAWDVAAAETRIREKTGATDGPNKQYATCFLWYDGDAPDEDGDGVPDKFGDYKFLACDVVDGDIKIMPRAVNAASSRLPNSTIPADDKDTTDAIVRGLKERMAEAAEESKESKGKDSDSILGKLRELILGKEEVVDVTKDELNSVLDERFEALTSSLVESLAKSVEAPSEESGDGEGATKEQETPQVETPAAEDATASDAITSEDVTKAIEEGLAPVVDAIMKTLDRVERIESALAIRTSLDGQEGGTEEASPTLKDAFGTALAGRVVKLR
jgi:hypothetical protein